MERKNLSFDQLMEIYNHIGEEERHFNSLELEYRKLASQWLLVSLGAIGFVLTKQELVPVNIWILVIGICVASSLGILVLWFLDMKVYHELLHAAFREGVILENEYPQYLPQIRNNMVKSQSGGDIIKRVMLYYFFSILLLMIIANISVWMFHASFSWWSPVINFLSIVVIILAYRILSRRSDRVFDRKNQS